MDQKGLGDIGMMVAQKAGFVKGAKEKLKVFKEGAKKLEDEIGTIPTAESREDIRAMDIIRQAAKLLENR